MRTLLKWSDRLVRLFTFNNSYLNSMNKMTFDKLFTICLFVLVCFSSFVIQNIDGLQLALTAGSKINIYNSDTGDLLQKLKGNQLVHF